MLLERGYGQANVERRVPNRVGTQYRITWLASQFTDIALLQLVDAGKLTLDGSICQAIPRCPPAWKAVTLRELETYKVAFGYPQARPDPRAPLARWITAMRAVRPTRRVIRADSRGSYLIRQFLVERVSGEPWWRYVHARILQRAGMRDTRYDTMRLPQRATPYDGTRPLRVQNAARTADRSDGIVSTVGDFLRYSRALDSGTLLSEAAREELTEFVPGSYIKGYYGVWRYGWLLGRIFGHLSEGQHAHGEPGWSSFFIRLPEDRLTVLLFQNKTQASGDVSVRLLGLLLGCPASAPPTPKPCTRKELRAAVV